MDFVCVVKSGKRFMVMVAAVHIPSTARKGLVLLLKRVGAFVPGLNVVDIDIPLYHFDNNDHKLEQLVLSREFHVSLGRTIPIRVHQRDSIVLMLRQKLQSQQRYARRPPSGDFL